MRMITRTAVALGLGAALALTPAATALAGTSERGPDVVSADGLNLSIHLDGVDVLGLDLGGDDNDGLLG